MKKNMELFIKGFIIGIGKIIPGVSGSILAIMMGIYDKGVYAISHFTSDIKENFLFLFKVGLGLLFSIMVGSQCILALLEHYYLATMLLFCGLISGTIPVIKKKTTMRNRSGNMLSYIVFVLFTLFSLLQINTVYTFSYSMNSFLFLVLVGLVEAATMIIPGISGTAILMMMGVYELLLGTYGNVLNLSYLSYNLFILCPFIIGVVLGFLTLTRLVDYSMRLHEEKTYYVILGFMYSSLFLLLQKAFSVPFHIEELGFGIVLWIVGMFLSLKFEHK